MRSENALPAAASGGLAKENRERDNGVLFLTYPVSGYAGQDQTSPARIQCLFLGFGVLFSRGKNCCLELLHAWIGANIRKWSCPVASGLLINGGPHSSRYDAALCMVRKTTRRVWSSGQPRHLPKVFWSGFSVSSSLRTSSQLLIRQPGGGGDGTVSLGERSAIHCRSISVS